MRNKNLLLALATISLAACNTQNKFTASKDAAHDKYLACYALDPIAKKQCTQSLQFNSEKLGFKQFLNNLNLPCESINQGPEFVEEEQAYLVRCNLNHQYLMQFNYETKEWKLIEETK